MSVETWLAFAAASTVLVVIPGPTILLVVSYALGQGWRTALPMAIGVALGDFTAMTFSLLGLGALDKLAVLEFEASHHATLPDSAPISRSVSITVFHIVSAIGRLSR